jgi:DNA gyrase inhibitor GyrI
MIDREIRVVSVPPVRVARFQAITPTPEMDAFAMMQAWAGPKGHLEDPAAHPVFGFNNPDSTVENPQHGYEFWVGVGAEEADEKVAYQDFAGGLYAVSECVLSDDQVDYLASWGRLESWVRDQGYVPGTHQWLESSPGNTPEGMILRLYYPIAKAKQE